MINPIVKTIELPDGRTITLETGKLAKQADGSVMLRMGNTMLLATVCAAKDAVPGTDFMPLQVEYKEKFSAFGRFPGGFTKREGRASDYEILTCRLVDRALRPLFPDNFHAEVYVNIILFSADGVDMPDALAGLAASAALAVSDIPFNGPISEVRVARINGQFVVHFVAIFAFHGRAYFFCQFHLCLALNLNGFVCGLHRFQQVLLGNLVHFAFHHHDVFISGAHHQVHIGLF